MIRTAAALAAALTLLSPSVARPVAQARPDAVQAVRLYVFDNGDIKGLDPKLFNFTREELKEVDFVNVSYLVVHPKGALMFDSGGIGDSHFTAGGGTVTEGVLSATTPLKPQLAAIGYTPADITYFAASHYHSDHMANANDFAGATWIVQKAERNYMFSDAPTGIIRPADYAALRTAKTHLLDDEDFDVFGDGTVVVKTAPGHTPGHQVLFVRLPKTGPVLLAGDLYHYPEEIATDRTPTFEFDAAQSRATRARILAFVKETGAQLWIEHDIATHAALPKAPAFVE